MSFQVDKSVTFGNLSPMNDSRLKELHDSLKPKGPLPKDHRRHRHGQHPHTWSEGRNKKSFPTNTNYAKLKILVHYSKAEDGTLVGRKLNINRLYL